MPENDSIALGTAISGLSLLSSLSGSDSDGTNGNGAEDSPNGNGDTTLAQRQQATQEAIERTNEVLETTQPGPEDKDAYSTAVLSLNDGETAEITVEPQDGAHLYVRKIYFDRRDDHDYMINVGGDVSSVAHRAVYTKPKKLTQTDRVVAEVTNDSGTTSTIDFEVEAWAEVQ